MKRHSTDTVSLVFGLLFAGGAAWWLTAGPQRLAHSEAWFGIGVLAILGTVGILTALFRSPRTDDEHPAPEVSEP